MAVEKASILNSMKTLLVNDSDLSKYELFLTGWKSGVLFSDPELKTEFGLTGTTNPSISSWSAVIVCTRATSTPIANQKIAVKFDLQWPKAFTNAVNGSKLFIEINQTLINDPTLIEDNYPSTDYALWLNIGTLNMATSYPATNSYIALYTYNGTVWTDVRISPTVDWKKVDLSELVQDIVTAWNIEATDIVANGNVSTSTPTAPEHATTKYYVDWQILSAGSVEALVDKDTYILWEDCLVNDSLFPETSPTFAQATGIANIGDVLGNSRYAFPIFGTWLPMTTVNLWLKKFVSPSVDLKLRIETNNAGAPSGTIYPTTTETTIATSGLTTSIVDKTVTLAQSITIPLWTIVRWVLYPGTYGSETINWTNYFGVAYWTNDTTTRGHKPWDWSSRTNNTSIVDSAWFTFWSTTSLSTNYWYRIYANITSNIITITKSPTCTATKAYIKSDAGAVLATFTFVWDQATGSYQITQWTYYRIELGSDGASYVVHYSWWQTYPQNRVNINYITGSNAGVNDAGSFNILSIYTLPKTFPYVSWVGILSTVLSKTDADFTYKLPTDFPRFATESKSAGEEVITAYYGLKDWFSGLSPVTYYASNTPWLISATAGTNVYALGNGIDTTTLKIDWKNLNKGITVWASPFSYTNTTGWSIQVRITGGTVNPIVINWVTVATATWIIEILPAWAVMTVTYTVLPTITYSDL